MMMMSRKPVRKDMQPTFKNLSLLHIFIIVIKIFKLVSLA